MIGRFDQRNHFHGGEAGLTAALVVERGDTHQTVGATLHAQSPVCVRGVHLERGRLDAGFFRVGGVHDLGLVSVAFRPTQVHAQQHLREIGRIHAAGAGTDRHHGGTFVVFAVKQRLDLHIVEILLDAFDFGLRLGQRVGVLFLLAKLDQGLHVLDALVGGCQTLELRLHRGQLAGHFLCVFRIVPQSGFGRFHFKVLGLGGQSIDVEGLGNGLVFGARFADRLGVIKFCHRLHHTFLLRS